MSRKPFLTAEWRYLAMLNYAINPDLLQPYVPRGTELDSFNGTTYVSMVGFLFQKTRVLGYALPFHTDFEEVNLRFYVRRKTSEGWQRATVFIKEIVPRFAIATVARLVYNENYISLPMRHRLQQRTGEGVNAVEVSYGWRFRQQWHHIEVKTRGLPELLVPGSEAEFIAEHYWGYAIQRDGGTVEYQVEHPPWRVWQVADYRFECDVAALYGVVFAEPLRAEPTSVFLAEGSPVVVYQGQRLEE